MVVVLQIEAISNTLLYIESIVVLLVRLLTIVQLFDDMLIFTSMIATNVTYGCCCDCKFDVI
jgi:hypothetical protein